MKLDFNWLIKNLGMDVAVYVRQSLAVHNKCSCPFCKAKKSGKLSDVGRHIVNCKQRMERKAVYLERVKMLRCFHPKTTYIFVPLEEWKKTITALHKAAAFKIYDCPYCGKTGFKGCIAIGNHKRCCRKNQTRDKILNREFAAMLRSKKSGHKRDLKKFANSKEFEDMCGEVIVQTEDGLVGEI